MNNELSRIHALVDDDGMTHLADYTYVGFNRTAQVDFGQPGVKFTWIKQGSEPDGDGGDQYTGWDRFGRAIDMRWIKNSSGSHLERIQHGYDRADNRLYRANMVASSSDKQDELYSYDGLYQLNDFQRGVLNGTRTGISGTAAAEEDFTYDPTGNWNEYVVRASGTQTLDQTRTHNKANELTAIDGSGSLVAEDAAGNMTKVPKPGNWSAAYDLKYDAWNRLVEVKDGGTTVATYHYDGLNRRITKTIGSNTRHYYYTDKWQIIEERLNTSTSAERQFVWGLRYTDDLVLRDRGSERLYAIQDYFQPTAVMDVSGVVQERYGYEAFGTSRVMTPTFGTRTSSSYEWETRFGAYRWDGETGLHQARHRYLHAGIGRWSRRDPIGIASGMNLYAYVNNAPRSAVDVYGLQQTTVPTSNGCGAQGGAQFPGDFGLWDFTPACDGHDICYGACGSNKSDCDNQFLADMLSVCDAYAMLPTLYTTCAALAGTYYAAVVAAGQDAFDSAQACCTPPTLPPGPGCSQCNVNSPPTSPSAPQPPPLPSFPPPTLPPYLPPPMYPMFPQSPPIWTMPPYSGGPVNQPSGPIYGPSMPPLPPVLTPGP
jgi:RHS repeat-associated protein